MHPVLGLAPDRRARPVYHPGSDFLAAACRQAVHEPGAGSERHQFFVDAIRLEDRMPFGAVLAAHRDPDVGIDDIRSSDGFGSICGRSVEAVAIGARQGELRACERASFGQRSRDVVALADESDLCTFDITEQLFDRQQVRERLKRMVGAG